MMFFRFATLLLLTVLLHVLLGWEWTILAGVAAGYVYDRRGWLLGALIVAADWLLLVLFNVLVDARAIGAMTAAVGSILGNMPSFAVVAMTLCIGFLLGLLGGAAGTQLRHLVARRRTLVNS